MKTKVPQTIAFVLLVSLQAQAQKTFQGKSHSEARQTLQAQKMNGIYGKKMSKHSEAMNKCFRTLSVALSQNKKEENKKRGYSRLIAETDRNTTDITDSNAYSYLSNFGYDPTADVIGIFQFDPNLITGEHYNIPDKSIHWSHFTGSYVVQDSALAFFDASHKVTNDYYANNLGTLDSTYYTYYPNQLIKQVVYRTYDLANSAWRNDQRDSYAYDVSNNPIEAVIEFWDTASHAWVPEFRDSLFYTGGNISSFKMDVYNVTTWENYQFATLVYNGANKVTSTTTETWDGSAWVNDSKTVNLYNGSNQMTSTSDLYWNGSIWTPFDMLSTKDSFTYSTGNNPSSDIFYVWDSVGNAWNKNFKNDYTYNSFNQIQTNDYYIWNVSTWDNQGNDIYYYETYTPNAVTDIQKDHLELSIYPNPVHDILHIQSDASMKISKVTITDLTGKLILEQHTNSSQINVEALAKGLYILNVQTEDKVYQQKFIKE